MKLIFLGRKADKSCHTWQLPASNMLVTGILCLTLSGSLTAQIPFEETAPRRYRIEFINKENSPFSLDAPEKFLSENALIRRRKQGIAISNNDLPVTPEYIDSIRVTGARVLTVSKWFNAITVFAPDDSILQKIIKLTFVKRPVLKDQAHVIRMSAISRGIQTVSAEQEFDYGISGWQTAIHKGQLLHNRGYTGRGMTIAVIDAGFYHVDQIEAFEYLWENGRILGTHDFVIAGSNVFNGHSHGMVVLSIIGANLQGELIGTAPDASFWLLRSEDTGSEYMIEEDNWTSAAEFADSAGADIITSSLGYSLFDDPGMDHSYADMDGNTTRISRAADLASSKGMLVVVSAGNQGTSDWHYISSPADADSVIAVGAIDGNGYVADFSSKGPSSDLQVKPDVVAIGKGTWVADYISGVRQGNGTSLSAPVIAGLSACLWQSDPDATAMEVREAIKESSDHFAQPDADYGFGIPNFNLASVLLKQRKTGSSAGDNITVFPNPFSAELYLIFPSPVDEQVDVSLIDLSGRVVLHRLFPPFSGRNNITITSGLTDLNKGVYMLKISAGSEISITKLIKF